MENERQKKQTRLFIDVNEIHEKMIMKRFLGVDGCDVAAVKVNQLKFEKCTRLLKEGDNKSCIF